jgi:hypothetical protein
MKIASIQGGTLLAALTLLLTGASTTADELDETARKEVRQAFFRLSEAESYTVTMVSEEQGKKPEDLFSAKTGQSGWTMLRLRHNADWHEFVFKGNRGVVAAGDKWATIEDLQSEEYLSKLPAELRNKMGRTVRSTLSAWSLPPVQGRELVEQVGVLRKEGSRYTGDLEPEVIAKLFGSTTKRYTFWIELKDGLPLMWGGRIEAVFPTLQGDFKSTAEWTAKVSAVGATKLDIPDLARKRLETPGE